MLSNYSLFNRRIIPLFIHFCTALWGILSAVDAQQLICKLMLARGTTLRVPVLRRLFSGGLITLAALDKLLLKYLVRHYWRLSTVVWVILRHIAANHYSRQLLRRTALGSLCDLLRAQHNFIKINGAAALHPLVSHYRSSNQLGSVVYLLEYG